VPTLPSGSGIQELDSSATSTTFGGLSPDVEYTFTVFAYNGLTNAAREGARLAAVNQDVTLILFEEFNHYRQIFTDGRPLPVDPQPAWFGYSIGRWEGDRLAVTTAGFNGRSWLDDTGHPHSEALKTTERFRRIDFGHMEMQVTIDDPQTYLEPFTVAIPFVLQPDTELIEDICENERDSAEIPGR